jgi:hypothetical protein
MNKWFETDRDKNEPTPIYDELVKEKAEAEKNADKNKK